jgi:hypothetical protein
LVKICSRSKIEAATATQAVKVLSEDGSGGQTSKQVKLNQEGMNFRSTLKVSTLVEQAGVRVHALGRWEAWGAASIRANEHQIELCRPCQREGALRAWDVTMFAVRQRDRAASQMSDYFGRRQENATDCEV